MADLDTFKNIDLVIDSANSNNLIPRQFSSLGDISGRTLTVQVAPNGVPASSSGAILRAVWTNLTSGITSIDDFEEVDTANGIYIFTYPEIMNTRGTVEMAIQIYFQGKVTTTRKFNIEVQGINGNFSKIIQSQEFYTLTNALNQATKANPRGFYSSLSELQNAFPKGDSGTYLVTDEATGIAKSYMFKNGKWQFVSNYQETQVANDSIGVAQMQDKSIITTKLDTKNLDILSKRKLARAITYSYDMTKIGKNNIEMLEVDSIPENRTIINVNENIKKQNFVGVGASITPATAYLLMTKLTDAQRHSLLNELFSPQEAYFKSIRISVAATDFTSESDFWSYNDVDQDFEMTNFSIGTGTPASENATKDLKYVIPVLQEILNINNNIQVTAAVWSPPAWMKTNKSMINGGSLIDEPRYYEAFCLYLRKFIDAYQKYGIPVHVLSPANEGTYSFAYPTTIWTGKSLAEFVKNYLSVHFDKYNVKAKIQIFDTNYNETGYLKELLENGAGEYADAVGFHSYSGRFSDVQNILRPFNKKLELQFTEKRTYRDDAPIDKFKNIVRDVIFKSIVGGCTSVTLWNLALDQDGKPTHNGGVARSGVVTIRTDSNSGYVKRNMEYYFLRGISQYTQSGAYVIESSKQGFDNGVSSFSIRNPDTSIVTALCNDTSSRRVVYVRVLGKIYRTYVEAYSMTVLLNGENVSVKNPNKDSITPSKISTSPNFVTGRTTNKNQKIIYAQKTVRSGESILLFVGRMDGNNPSKLVYEDAVVSAGVNSERRFNKIASKTVSKVVDSSTTFYRVLDVYLLEGCEEGTHNITIKYSFVGGDESNNNFAFNYHAVSVSDYTSYSVESASKVSGEGADILNSVSKKQVYTFGLVGGNETINLSNSSIITSENNQLANVNLRTILGYSDGDIVERKLSWSSGKEYLSGIVNVYFE